MDRAVAKDYRKHRRYVGGHYSGLGEFIATHAAKILCSEDERSKHLVIMLADRTFCLKKGSRYNAIYSLGFVRPKNMGYKDVLQHNVTCVV